MAAEEVRRPTTPPPENRLAARLVAEEPQRQRIPRTKVGWGLSRRRRPGSGAR